MILGAARIVAGPEGWRVIRQPGPDLAALMIGRPVAEVAETLPRLFNLCRVAQAAAARLALGMTDDSDPRAEVIRDHLAQVYVTLRRAFGLAPLRPDPAGIFGPAGRLPADLADLADWMAGDFPAAELARRIRADLPAPLGAAPALPAAPHGVPGAFENSPASRQADHPLMLALEATGGCSPLWRYLGMLADLGAATTGHLPPPRRLPDGTAVVQAARGAYALRLDQAGGRLVALHRLTPTDHQLAPGGALSQALAGLPADRPDLAARLVALHDPCVPVSVEGADHA